MKRKAIFWNFIWMLLFVLLFLPNTVMAQRREQNVPLRVGFVEEHGYFYKDAYGEYSGYISELLHSIAMFGNYDLEVVEFSSYAEENQALLEGRIDMETAVPRTEQWEQQYAFSNLPTATIVLSLVVKDDNNNYVYGDANAVNGMNVAAVKGDATGNYFKEWCQKNNLYPIMKYYENNDLALESLVNGTVDSMIGDYLLASGCRPLLHFANMPCFAVFNKNKMALKLSFDQALEQLLYAQPLYEQQLYYEYIVSGIYTKSIFSHGEKDYLAKHKNFTIALPESMEPYCYKTVDGRLAGIMPDFYKHLGKAMGINFAYKTYKTSKDAEDAVVHGEADILGVYSGSTRSAYRKKLRLVTLAGNQPIVKITTFGKEKGKTAAILASDSTALRDKLVSEYGYHVLTFDNMLECYAATQNDSADCIICDSIMANWLFNNNRTDHYSLTPLNAQGKIYMAVSPNNLELYRILAHEYRMLNPKFSSFVTSNVLPKESFRGFIERMPVWGIMTFAAIMSGLVVLLIALMLVLRRRYREKALLADKKAENEKEKLRLENIRKNANEKNMFFSNISHDMRTPLNAIISYAYLAKKEEMNEEIREYLEKISLSGNLLLELINDTLLVSKITSGKLDIQAEPVSTTEINKVLSADISSAAERQGVIFTMDDSRLRPRTIMADKLKLEKILLNLLSNAVKFTPAGKHVWYTVEDDHTGDQTGDIICTIRDEGIGMSEEYQKKLYTPFMQENRPGFESQGTGLGLSIVKQLVDLLGGTISMQSKKNEGTIFTVRFHLQEVESKNNAEEFLYEQEHDLDCLKGKVVLLCEDNKINADIATRLMSNKGIVVDSAANGKLGLEKFQASIPGFYAVILMDLRMPVLDGYQATKQLRGLERADAKKIPVIAMTADAFEEDVKMCLEVGMNDHVAKPIEPQKLYMALARAIQGN